MTSISFLIPTYNRAGYLRECLESVLGQAGAKDQVIVIDDGSTDDTLAMLEEFGTRVTVVRQANRGKAEALNNGLAHASGKWVWIVDDDDVLAPNARTRLLRLAQRHRSADIIYGRHLRFTMEDGKRAYQDTGYWTTCNPDSFYISTLEDFFAHQPGMLVKRKLYEQVGFFDPQVDRSIDYAMLVRLAKDARAVGTDDVIFYQRLHDGRRGRRGQRHSANSRSESWMEHDQSIFKKLHARLPLKFYLPTDESLAGKRRRALIQRGVIMARRKLWDYAIRDFEDAMSISEKPLSDASVATIRRATASKYGCDELLADPEVARALRQLAEKGPVGRQILRELAQSLRWRIRAAAAGARLISVVAFTLRWASWWTIAIGMAVAARVSRQPTEVSASSSMSPMTLANDEGAWAHADGKRQHARPQKVA